MVRRRFLQFSLSVVSGPWSVAVGSVAPCRQTAVVRRRGDTIFVAVGDLLALVWNENTGGVERQKVGVRMPAAIAEVAGGYAFAFFAVSARRATY